MKSQFIQKLALGSLIWLLSLSCGLFMVLMAATEESEPPVYTIIGHAKGSRSWD